MAGELVPISSSLKHRWKTRPVELPASWIGVQAALGFGPTGVPLGFQLCRRKGGPDVWLVFSSGFHLNLTSDDARPSSFAEARRWIVAFARDHGCPAREVAGLCMRDILANLKSGNYKTLAS
jgi:hypothetical protein